MASLNRHVLLVVLSALVPLLLVAIVLALVLVKKEREGTFYAEAMDVRNALGLWDNLLLLSPSADHLNLMHP